MTKVKCFMRDESSVYPGKWKIVPIHENFHLDSTEGSFNVICARLFNLSYADYLRMCRDCFGAEIVGKNSRYPIAYFKRSNELDVLIENLNARANLVLWERNHPDYEEHKEFVRKENPLYYKAVTGHE